MNGEVSVNDMRVLVDEAVLFLEKSTGINIDTDELFPRHGG